MQYLRYFTIVISVVCIFNPAFSEPFDGSKTLLCSIHSILECGRDYQCKQVTPDSVNLVNFFEVSVVDKEIRAASLHRIGSKTSIERIEHMGGNLLIQGGEDDEESNSNGVGWSMIIDEANGEMSFSGIASSFSLTGFGACTMN